MKNKNYLKGTSLLRSLVMAVMFAITGLWTMNVMGQLAPTYPLTIGSATYNSISATGTSRPTLVTDNAQLNVTGLSPAFTINGVAYNNYRMSSNGWLILYGATAPTTTTESGILTSAITNAAVIFAPMNADLHISIAGGAVPGVYTQTIGNEHIFEWKDMSRYVLGGGSDLLNFQIRLNTATGSITYAYGVCTNGSLTSSFVVGWKTNGTVASSTNFSTDVNNLLINATGSPTTCDWSNAITGISAAASMYMNAANPSIVPPFASGNGLTYTWAFPGTYPTAGTVQQPVRTFTAVSGISSSGATVNWTAPASATNYDVEYRLSGSSCTWTSAGNVSSPTITLTGLIAGTKYQVRVKAKNASQSSIFSCVPIQAGGTNTDGYSSNTGTFTTTQNCGGPPTGSSTTLITSSSAQLNWTNNASADLGYNIQYRAVGNLIWTTGTAAAGVTDFPIPSGLTPATNYEWQIQSVCSGPLLSGFTASTLFTTLDLCSGPPTGRTTTLVTNNSAQLNWTNNAAATSGYNIRYRQVGNLTWTTASIGAGVILYSIPSGLTGNTAYEWQIQSICNSGADLSAFSPSVNFTTLADPLNYSTAHVSDIEYITLTGFTNIIGPAAGSSIDDNTASIPASLFTGAANFDNFFYQGGKVTAIGVTNNGHIALNAGSVGTYPNNINTAGSGALICPFYEDLYGATGSQAAVRYKLIPGATTSQDTLAIEWVNQECFSYSGPNINFMIKLCEGSNVIIFDYGTMQTFDGTNPSAVSNGLSFNYSVGLRAATFGSPATNIGQLMALQKENTAFFDYAGANITNKGLNKLVDPPACNSRLSFTPGTYAGGIPPPTTAPSNDEPANAVTLQSFVNVPSNFCGTYYTSFAATTSAGYPVNPSVASTVPDDDVWFKFVANGVNTTTTVRASGGYQPVLELFSSTAPNGGPYTGSSPAASLSAVDAVTNMTANPNIESIVWATTIGAEYYVRVYNAGGGVTAIPGTVTLSSGVITAIGAGTGGSGYWNCYGGVSNTQNPIVTITDPTGSGAVVEVTGVGASASSITGYTISAGGSGYTAPVITVAAPGAGVSGQFSILVTAPTPPANDDCAGAVVLPINLTCVNTAGVTTNASPSTAPASTCGNADDDLFYSFAPSASQPNLRVEVQGVGTFNPSVQVFDAGVSPGNCGSLSSMQCVSGTGAGTTTNVDLTGLLSSHTYFVRVFHSGSGAASGTFNICVHQVVPACATSPSPVNNAVSIPLTGTTLSVTADASATSYDVYFGTDNPPTNIVNGTNQAGNSYVTGALIGATDYFWRIVPRNSSGPATGCAVFKFTAVAPPPANDACGSAVTITPTLGTSCTSPTSGTTANSTQDGPATIGGGCTSTTLNDVWYSFTADGTSSYTIDVTNTAGDMVVELFSGTCGAFSSISCADGPAIGTETLLAGTLAAGVYYYRVLPFNGADASFTTCVYYSTPLPGDFCSNAINLGAQTSPYSGTTVGAANDFNNACASGNICSDLVFYINVPAGATLTIGQTTNNYDSENNVYYGNTCPGSNLIACFDDPDIQDVIWTNITGVAQTVWWVQDGYSTSSNLAGNFTLAWSVATCPPPTGLGATNITSTSANMTWTCTACTGTFELEYGPQGFSQGTGTSIIPAVSPQPTTTVLTPSTPYDFYVRQNCGGGDFSAWAGPFTFTTSSPPPANDLCSGAIDIICGDALSGTTVGATVDAGLPVGCGGGNGLYPAGSVWYHFVGTGQLINVTTCNATGFDTKLSVFSGSCGSYTCVANNDDDGVCSFSTLRSTVQFQSQSGTDYYILVHGYSTTGAFVLSLTCSGACTPATTNDACANAISLTSGVSITGNNFCANTAPANPSCNGFQSAYDVWYTFNSGLSTSGSITLTAGTAVGLRYAIYTGSCGSLTSVYCSTAPPSPYNFTPSGSATQYYLQIWSTNLANRGDFTLQVDFTGGSCMAANAGYTSPVCMGQTLHLTSAVTFGTGPFTYQWSGTGTFVSSTTQNADVNGAATGTYTVTITDAGNPGCSITKTVPVTLNPLPDPVVNSNAPVCEGIQLTLFGDNLDGAQINTGWAWSGPSFSSGSQNPTINNPSLANAGTYTLTVTNSNGCSASTSVQIDVNPNPVISIGTQTNVLCNGLSTGSVDLDVTSGTPGYLFDLDGNTSSNGIYGGLAAGPYTATVTDVNGCSSTSLVVTITEPPVLTVGAGSNTPVCSGTSLNLNATPVGGTSGYSYAWTGPNGPIPSVQNPTIASATVSDGGNYSVLVTDAHSCTATSGNHLVQVTASPTATISNFGNNNICLSQPATVTLSFTGTGSWNYTVSDGTQNVSGTALTSPVNINITPITTGTHTYTITAVGNTACPSGGTSTGSATVFVSNTPPGIVTGAFNGPSEACSGTVSLITVNPIGGTNIRYSWNTGTNSSLVQFSTNIGGPFSPGPFQTTTNQVYAQFGSIGAGQSGYYVCVQGVNGCGSTANRCLWIRGVVNGPGAITPANAVVACPNDVKSYSCGASGGASVYNWTLSGSSTPITSGQGTTNVQVTFPAAFTSGQLCVTAALACGGSSTSAPRCMTISKNPANPNVPTGAATVCPGAPGVSYSIPAVPGASGYNWTIPANATIASGTNSPSITVNFPTPFTGSSSVCVTTTSACGTSAAKCKTVVSGIPNQPAGITGPLTNVCGSTVQYSVVNPIASSYTWTPPAGTTIANGQGNSTILLNVSSTFTSGSLTVVANSAMCPPGTSAPRTSSTIWGRPNTPGAITANPALWCSGGYVNFSVIPAAPLPTYNWTVSNGTIDAGQGNNNIDVTWGTNAAGTVSVRASNGCGLSAGTSSQNFSSGCREEGISTSSATDFSVYPNPAHDKVTVSIYVKEQAQFSVKLRDMSGRVILSEDHEGAAGLNAYNMDLKGFAKGIYAIEIQSTKESWKTKVIIE